MLSRRRCLQWSSLASLSVLSGCVPQVGVNRRPDLVWGQRGFAPGSFQKARAIAISPADELYIVDKMGRIQVFDADGNYLRGWNTPEIAQGKPVGMGWSNDDLLMVADTHYYRVLFYTPEGQIVSDRIIGGELGDAPGQFQFVTDVIQDARGHYWIGQYGQLDRIQEFTPEGQFVQMFGSQGDESGRFSRPQGLEMDDQGLLWVADSCNHRIQVFDTNGPKAQLVDIFGKAGNQPGELQYPYGLVFDRDSTLLICEHGNHRIQRFSKQGESLEIFSGHGTQPGQLLRPWGLVLDSKRRLHVIDTENFRVQRFQI